MFTLERTSEKSEKVIQNKLNPAPVVIADIADLVRRSPQTWDRKVKLNVALNSCVWKFQEVRTKFGTPHVVVLLDDEVLSIGGRPISLIKRWKWERLNMATTRAWKVSRLKERLANSSFIYSVGYSEEVQRLIWDSRKGAEITMPALIIDAGFGNHFTMVINPRPDGYSSAAKSA